MLLLLMTFFAAAALHAQQEAINVLQQRCHSCHGAALSMGGLQLHTGEAAAKGGIKGPVIVPGNAGASRLIQAVSYTGELKMPPSGKLPDKEIEVLRNWVNAGAKWPSSVVSQSSQPQWWAFKPPVKPQVPEANRDWVRTPVDAFILARLLQEKMTPAPEADRRTLIRRATFDLHGLPPSAERVEKFVNDPDPRAYEKLVDELLASPRYGEKWGRHWLDLVRYGDTSGFEQDPYLLYAFRYRDYVIESFNNDKPYDRFVKEQIAGDELYPDDPSSAQGTGYFTVGPNRDMLYKVEDINRIETLTDFVDTTSSVFLGLTVGCARCHDHKFDPIPQRDYYRLQSIFVPLEKSRVFLQYDPARGYDLAENNRHARLREIGAQLEAILRPYQKKISDEKLAKLPAAVRDAFATEEGKRTAEQRALVQENQRKISASPDETRAIMSTDDSARLRKIEVQLASMFTGFKAGPFSPAVRDISREAPRTFLPGRNGAAGEQVIPGFPIALGGGDIPDPPLTAESTHRRKALAEWIARGDNPLTARVFVNRVWQGHFGRGIVTTPSDFGTRGAKPTHPELLDWLATDFVANGWSVKKLHRLIMTSSVYRTAVAFSDRDPENKLLSHFTRRRLAPEEIRDAMLQASGSLNLEMGGRPVVPAVAREELFGLSQNPDSAWIVTADEAQQKRRSIYMLQRRTFRPAMFESFDAPDGVRSCARRESSNTAPQSLTMLNGRWTVDEANRLGEKIASAPDIPGAAWRAVFARDPSDTERESAVKFIERQRSETGTAKAAASELVRALFNTNEFLYVD